MCWRQLYWRRTMWYEKCQEDWLSCPWEVAHNATAGEVLATLLSIFKTTESIYFHLGILSLVFMCCITKAIRKKKQEHEKIFRNTLKDMQIACNIANYECERTLEKMTSLAHHLRLVANIIKKKEELVRKLFITKALQCSVTRRPQKPYRVQSRVGDSAGEVAVVERQSPQQQPSPPPPPPPPPPPVQPLFPINMSKEAEIMTPLKPPPVPLATSTKGLSRATTITSRKPPLRFQKVIKQPDGGR